MPRRLPLLPVALAVLFVAAVCRAELRSPAPEVDLGEVRAGAPLGHDFALVNSGAETLEVLTVRGNCGCLAPRMAQRVFAVGERGTLRLEVDTLPQAAGPHLWALQVAWRSGDKVGQTVLSLRGRVVRELNVEPAALTVFADRAVRHDVLLTDLRPQALAVTGVRSTSPRVVGRILGPERDPAGRVCIRVRLELADDFPDGKHDEAVFVQTDDPTYRELRIPVSVIRRPRARTSAAPDAVTLAAAKGQPLPSRIVLLQDRDGTPVQVDRVETDDPALSARWAAGPGTRATVRIAADRAKVPAAGLRSAVHIHLKEPVGEVVTVLVTCLPE